MTRTTPFAAPTQTAEALLKDIGFVLAMSQKVKDAMGTRPTPPAAPTARTAARRQLVVAA